MSNLSTILITDNITSAVEVVKWHDDTCQQLVDQVAEEVPIALIYNGVSHAVMLASPQDLEDFALGFSLAEGIIDSDQQLYGIDIEVQSNGIGLQLEIASEQFIKLKERRRSLTGRTGCGLCGAESLAQALRLPSHRITDVRFERKILQQSLKSIAQHQVMQKITGATHACALVSQQGEILLVREDVGRHNALDKLLGAKARLKECPQTFVITTSRASYEMVQKVAVANIPLLMAISAPTGLAIRLAKQCNITLIGFSRNEDCVIYVNPDSVV